MARLRMAGKNFFILLLCDSIIESFHPLVQDEVINKFVERFRVTPLLVSCRPFDCTQDGRLRQSGLRLAKQQLSPQPLLEQHSPS